MSHDIKAYVTEERTTLISETKAYMGAFRMLKEQTGWSFYNSLNASEMNCGISGCKGGKYISLDTIKNASNELVNLSPKGKLSSEGRDEYIYRMPILYAFFNTIVWWCEENKKDRVYMYFS